MIGGGQRGGGGGGGGLWPPWPPGSHAYVYSMRLCAMVSCLLPRSIITQHTKGGTFSVHLFDLHIRAFTIYTCSMVSVSLDHVRGTYEGTE